MSMNFCTASPSAAALIRGWAIRSSKQWMRSSRLLERLPANAEVATVLGSIPASSDTTESEEAADEAVLNKVLKKC